MEFSRKTTCVVIAVLCFLFSALAVEGRRRFGDDDGGWISVNGGRFELNGSPFLFNGFNAYWLMHVAADVGQRGKVTEVLREASAAGLSVCRTWAFADGSDPTDLQTSPGVYNERVFQGLDFVISEARKFGVRLILNLVNNYNDFGGRPQYANWARNAGEQIAGDDDFYTNPVIKGYYKNHVMTVLTRMNTNSGIAYKDDPTIMAWELINEPRCASDLSGNTVNGWIAEMASYAKSVDNKHLVGTGMEGFYGDTMPERKQYNPGYTVGTDFIAAHQVPDVDFASIHAYTDQWESGKSDDDQMAFMESWIGSHWQDSQNILKKPLILAEFGKSSRDPGFTEAGRDAFMTKVYTDTYNLAKSGGAMAGSMIWQLTADGMEDLDDGYSIVLADNPSTAGIIAGQSYVMSKLSQQLLSRPRVRSFGGAWDCRCRSQYYPRRRHHHHRGLPWGAAGGRSYGCCENLHEGRAEA
nr:Mannan endo-1,4-beta-mannosidase 5 [Ipomoea batatas]